MGSEEGQALLGRRNLEDGLLALKSRNPSSWVDGDYHGDDEDFRRKVLLKNLD